MYTYIAKRDGKTIAKGFISDLAVLNKTFTEWHIDEITVRKPAVDVLPTQAELEARGKKD